MKWTNSIAGDIKEDVLCMAVVEQKGNPGEDMPLKNPH